MDASAELNSADLHYLVTSVLNTWVGDANLDGEFSSSDLVAIFEAGQYEDDQPLNSTWSTGDWTSDGDFTSADLVAAFTDGGYEQGPRAAVASVPEPGAAWIWLSGLALTALRSRLRRRG